MVSAIYKMKKIIKKIFRYFLNFIPDRIYIKLQYLKKTGKFLNLNNPILFNEKIQWLKLYNQKPQYTKMVDKYEVQEYITNIIGDEYLIPIYGVWDTFNEIPFKIIPDKFILKCTHDSGSFRICKDKHSFDMEAAKKHFNNALKRNYYFGNREWVYKNIKPRIIAQKLLIDETDEDLRDYKIFCFNGEPKLVQVDFDKFSNWKMNYYSPQWEYQHLSLVHPTSPETIIPKPELLEQLLQLTKVLTIGIPHVRVDFFVVNKKIYFGEFTFYNYAGYEQFYPYEWNKIIGDWLILPENKTISKNG